MSRCVDLSLEGSGQEVYFARRARKEGIDQRPLTDYVQLCRNHDNDFRAVLQDLEAGVLEK